MSNPRSKLGARIRMWGTVCELLFLAQTTPLSFYVHFEASSDISRLVSEINFYRGRVKIKGGKGLNLRDGRVETHRSLAHVVPLEQSKLAGGKGHHGSRLRFYDSVRQQVSSESEEHSKINISDAGNRIYFSILIELLWKLSSRINRKETLAGRSTFAKSKLSPLVRLPWLAGPLASIQHFFGVSISRRSVRASTFTTSFY